MRRRSWKEGGCKGKGYESEQKKKNINTLNACSFQEPDCMPPKNNHEAGKDAVEEGLQVSPRPNQSKKVMTVAQRLFICVRQQVHIKISRRKYSCQCWQISSTNTSRMVNV